MLKVWLYIFTFSFCFLFRAQVKPDLIIPNGAKIGLSLAGGGAKGFAHVGVLKVLDSLGVKIDYISGTSMGAIIGGLYAAGYSGKDLEKIVLQTDFYSIIANEKTRQEKTFFNKNNDKYLLSLPIFNGKINLVPKAISSGQRNVYLLKDLFRNVANVDDFSKLPVPFFCVATNLESGEMKILDKGDIVSAVMASSAFPSLMDPVKIGDSLYIDGAITINYPSKPLKDRGMKLVIGVDLSQDLAKRSELNSAVDILNQVIDFSIQNETKHQYQYTDINIRPELGDATATSYGDKSSIINNGQKAAYKFADVLNKLPKRKNELLRAPLDPSFSNVYKIDSIRVVNTGIYGPNHVIGKMGIKIPSLQTYNSINQMVDKLYATNNYTFITYDIVQQNGKNILVLKVTEDQARYFMKFSLHYDKAFRTGLLVNFTAKRLLFKNSTTSADIVLGDKTRYYFNYFVDNGYIPGFGLYASGMRLNLHDRAGNDAERWSWFRNEAFLHASYKDRYAVGGGFSYDIFRSSGIRDTNNHNTAVHNSFFNPYIFIRTDTQDDRNFPTKGILLNAEGKVIKPIGKSEGSLQTKFDFKFATPLLPKLAFQFNAFSGLSFSNELPYFYKFRAGGLFQQSLNNFVSFPGYDFGSLAFNDVIVIQNSLQFRIKKNFFVRANANFGNLFDDIKMDQLINFNHSSGALELGYRSPFGQLKVNYAKSLDNKNNGVLNIILGNWF